MLSLVNTHTHTFSLNYYLYYYKKIKKKIVKSWLMLSALQLWLNDKLFECKKLEFLSPFSRGNFQWIKKEKLLEKSIL